MQHNSKINIHTHRIKYFHFLSFTPFMDFSRLKKVFAGMSVAAITLTNIGTVIAYSDVPAGVWFEEAVESFVDNGYLDEAQTRFRGGDPATRAEFVKLIVMLNGGLFSTPPAVPSFDDVASGAWYYSYMEEAGKEGWVRGDGNCYGSHPCYGRPAAKINRAEAASLIVRAFGLEWTGDAPQFTDNPSGQWYTDAIQTAADHCVLQGDDATKRVRPSDSMNRAEMVTMLYRVDQGLAFGEDCGTDDMGGEPMVTDVTATSATTVEVEFSVALDSDAAVDVSHYMVTDNDGDEIDVASVDGIDDTTVELTLATALAAGEDYTLSVEDMMSEDGDTFSDSADFRGYSPIVRGEGTLEVSLSSQNPSGDAVPKGAVGVTLVSMDLTASCDDSVTVQEITVLHEGFGDEQDIDGVYTSVDGARSTRKRTLDSEDQTADLRFSQPLVIGACDTVTVDIMADFNSTATTAAEHNIAVELPTDVKSNAKDIDGNFPLRGSTFRVAAVTSGKITVDYLSVTPTQIEVGDKGVSIGRFELSTDSVEDQTIYSMTFEQNGSAGDGDIANIRVQRTDGTVLTNVAASTVGDFVTLVFDPPFTILEGDKITLSVAADIMGGASDTVVMHFEETSDLFAVGNLYGYGVNGQLYGSQVSIPTDDPTTVTIDAGELTVEIDGPVQQKYTRDDDDAVLANVKITTGGEPVDIKDLFILVEGQTSTGAGLVTNSTTTTDKIHEVLEDVEIRNKVTGQTVSGVRITTTNDCSTGDFCTSSSETWQIYRFDDFVVNGSEVWEFRVDFIDNAAGNHPKNGDKFRIHICGESKNVLNTSNSLVANTTGCSFGGLRTSSTSYQMDVEGLSTGDDVGDVRPRGTITGNFHRIANPQITIRVQSQVATDTSVKNSKNVNLLRFEARAGEAEDVLFTKAIFEAESGSLLNGQNYSLWVDTDGDSKVDTKVEDGVAAQSSLITFSELVGGGYVIPAEETVLFEVHANIAASLTNNDIRLRFDTGSTYLEAEEVDDGSSLSGIQTNGTCASSCDFIVDTRFTNTNWLLVDQGDLFVIKDTEPIRQHQLLAGTLGDPVLRLQLRAQNENVDVTDLQITSSGSRASSVDRLELYLEGATTPFTTATVGGCGNDDVLTTNPKGPTRGAGSAAIQTFCANMESQQLVVKEGDRLDVLIRPRLKNDSDGATVNQPILLWITHSKNAGGVAASDNSTGSGAVRARGMESSNNLTGNDADSTNEGEVFIGVDSVTTNSDIMGNEHTVVFAKLTSITNASTDADGTAVPTGPSPIAQFKFSTAANNNALNGLNKFTISGVIFNVTATNIDLDGSAWKFYNKKDNSTKSSCSMLGATNNSGALVVECKGLKAHAVATEINSGDSETFVIEADIDNPQVSSSANSTLQVVLQDFTTPATAFTSATNHLHWLDEDTSTTFFYWVEHGETQVKSTSYKS